MYIPKPSGTDVLILNLPPCCQFPSHISHVLTFKQSTKQTTLCCHRGYGCCCCCCNVDFGSFHKSHTTQILLSSRIHVNNVDLLNVTCTSVAPNVILGRLWVQICDWRKWTRGAHHPWWDMSAATSYHVKVPKDVHAADVACQSAEMALECMVANGLRWGLVYMTWTGESPPPFLSFLSSPVCVDGGCVNFETYIRVIH